MEIVPFVDHIHDHVERVRVAHFKHDLRELLAAFQVIKLLRGNRTFSDVQLFQRGKVLEIAQIAHLCVVQPEVCELLELRQRLDALDVLVESEVQVGKTRQALSRDL